MDTAYLKIVIATYQKKGQHIPSQFLYFTQFYCTKYNLGFYFMMIEVVQV